MDRVSNNNNFDNNEFVLKINDPRFKDKNLYYKGNNLFNVARLESVIFANALYINSFR